MARFLKALQGLQTDSPETSPPQEAASGSLEASPEVRGEPKSERSASSAAAVDRPMTQTIVMPEPEEKPEPSIVSLAQNELIQKLTQQLAGMLKQRDKVAREVTQVKEELASHDRRHEDEILRLRDTLETHQQSSKKIEAEMKEIQNELRNELQKQQEEFAQKLSEVEQRVQAQSASQTLVMESNPEAEIQQVREQLASHDKRYEEEIVRLRDSLESHQQSSQTIQAELLKQLKRQEESFSKKLSDVEQRVQRQATAPVPVMAGEPTSAPPKSSTPLTKATEHSTVFKPQDRPVAPEKPIPVINPLRQAIDSLDDPQLSLELIELCDSIFGPVEPSSISQPQVIFLGTCVPGRDTASLAIRLAAWLSQNSCDVFMIDGALKNKTLSEQLGLRLSPGLFETVRRETYRQDGTYRDSDTGISVIPAGKSSFMLSGSEQDLESLRDQVREILKTCSIVLIAGEGPDSAASWLLAQVANKTYLQADLGSISREDIQATLDCYHQAGIEPAGLIATSVRN
ncbi:hypothetical protein C5Y96_16170 [Blastopirellula marina]|uniref:CobQ/CobB/MinD/ParA nucleotide binding domain-containing protein n=1 Tax=Blastopirellula marina TaxID=124 RepID=A0A2S8F6Z9_9BACT|nr:MULTISPECIES: hypothetical protein [Pirellulaceae]PQO27918.1 hypothetical protein C5Y96_16170 [Blastopirellula marina]RCS48343.1 hypothetical protein DTL36_16190 [Bremerella cremea]